jgi:hypothetical protein
MRRLHLFWAFPENWDKKTAPIVAFFPLDMDPEERKTIPAFDANGNRIELSNHDATVATQRPVLVITYNERSGIDGKVKSGVMIDNNNGILTPLQATASFNVNNKNSTTLSSVATRMTITYVKVPSSQHSASDEPWGQGGTEWIVCTDHYSIVPPGALDWVGKVGDLGAYAPSYTPNFQYYIAPTRHLHIKYFEDDYTVGYYDIFDDWWGWHIIDGIGGAFIQTGVYHRTESFPGGVSTDATYVLAP